MAGINSIVKVYIRFLFFKLIWCLFLIPDAKLGNFPELKNTLFRVFFFPECEQIRLHIPLNDQCVMLRSGQSPRREAT